jgi:hypothetical protein
VVPSCGLNNQAQELNKVKTVTAPFDTQLAAGRVCLCVLTTEKGAADRADVLVQRQHTDLDTKEVRRELRCTKAKNAVLNNELCSTLGLPCSAGAVRADLQHSKHACRAEGTAAQGPGEQEFGNNQAAPAMLPVPSADGPAIILSGVCSTMSISPVNGKSPLLRVACALACVRAAIVHVQLCWFV